MEYINATSHPIVVFGSDDGVILVVAPSGTEARLVENTFDITTMNDDVPMTMVSLGGITGLPEPAPDTLIIASMPFCMGLRAAGVSRDDVAYPFGQVRDYNGRIIGCRSLARLGAHH